MNTLRVKVPRNAKNYGLSLGDSLQMWYQAQYLIQRFNLNCKIILQEQDWPELSFISLPNTETRKKDITINSKKIDIDCMIQLLLYSNCEFLNDHDNWYIEDWFFFDDVFECHENDCLTQEKLYENKFVDKNIFKVIKFKDDEIDNFINENLTDKVALHLDRDIDILISIADIKTFPHNLREDFYKNYIFNRHIFRDIKPRVYYTQFVPDSEYYKVIEECLEYEINQKFYISSSSHPRFHTHYKERYRNIYDKFDYMDNFLKLLSEKYEETQIKDLNMVYKLFDLFALIKSKMIIQPYSSPFAKFATQVSNNYEFFLPIFKYQDFKLKKIRKLYDDRLKYSELSIIQGF